MGAEAADGDLDHRAEAGGGHALHHIGGDAGGERLLDLLGLGLLGEEDDGAGLVAVEGAHALELVARGVVEAADDHLGTGVADMARQVARAGGDGDDGAAGGGEAGLDGSRALWVTLHKQDAQHLGSWVGPIGGRGIGSQDYR